jgi:hypothetical protein
MIAENGKSTLVSGVNVPFLAIITAIPTPGGVPLRP